MKRFALTLALSTAMAGCWSNEPTPAPAPKAHAAVETKITTPTAERKIKGYFELKQDGKTYVTEDLATLTKIKSGDKSGTWAPEWTDVNGKVVVLQDDSTGLAAALKKDYEKSHLKIEAK